MYNLTKPKKIQIITILSVIILGCVLLAAELPANGPLKVKGGRFLTLNKKHQRPEDAPVFPSALTEDELSLIRKHYPDFFKQ